MDSDKKSILLTYCHYMKLVYLHVYMFEGTYYVQFIDLFVGIERLIL